LIYDFHYNVIKKRYGNDCRLLFSDNESLCYHILPDDLYEDVMEFRAFLDTSEYYKEHFLYCPDNAKVIGIMKDETKRKSPIEFVGLRSNMYSLLVGKYSAKKTAKGIKKSYRDKHVCHDMNREVLFDESVTHAQFRNFCSRCHKVETVEFNKTCLSPYDDKRYVEDDGVNTYTYFHVRNKM
jgi:hypothetical protein